MKTRSHITNLFDLSKKYAFEDPKRSFELAKEAHEIANSLQMEIEKAFALYHMAFAARVMSDYVSALSCGFDALEIMKKNNNVFGMYKVHNIIGIIYFYFGSYEDALEHFLEALDLIENKEDPKMESSLINNIGEVYRESGEYNKALKYYKKALKISLAHNLDINASAIYLNVGEIYHISGKYKASYSNILRGYEIVKGSNHILEQGEAETKLGKTKVVQGKFKEAKTLFLSALEKFNTIDNKYYLVDLLIEMAKLDSAMGYSPLRNLSDALDISLNRGLEKKTTSIYKMISEYYEEKKDYKLAFEYYKSYHMKLGELEASNLSKKLEILSLEFDFYKEKNEVNRFKKLSEKLLRDIESTKQIVYTMMNTNKNLLKESLIDELTQLLNRRGVEKKYFDLFEDSEEILGAVIVIDIDHFKIYNDTWGHVQGDHCLKLISNTFRRKTFNSFIIGRYGGEEFVGVVKLNSVEEANEACEKIRKSIEKLKIKANTINKDVVTISVGAYFGPLQKNDFTKHLTLADVCLYDAKNNGRNNVKCTDCVKSRNSLTE